MQFMKCQDLREPFNVMPDVCADCHYAQCLGILSAATRRHSKMKVIEWSAPAFSNKCVQFNDMSCRAFGEVQTGCRLQKKVEMDIVLADC